MRLSGVTPMTAVRRLFAVVAALLHVLIGIGNPASASWGIDSGQNTSQSGVFQEREHPFDVHLTSTALGLCGQPDQAGTPGTNGRPSGQKSWRLDLEDAHGNPPPSLARRRFPVVRIVTGSSKGSHRYDALHLLRVACTVKATKTVVDDILPKPNVTEPKLQNVVDDLYKGTANPNRVGTGTTADAVRNEVATGQATGGRFHTQKAEQYSNALRSLLKKGNLSSRDRLVAQSLIDDLQNALGKQP